MSYLSRGGINIKIVRTDGEIECHHLDKNLRAGGAELVLLPGCVREQQLVKEVSDADLLLTCYTPITAQVIDEARKLKGIVKYGVGIDAIDIAAAKLHRIPVVNIPDYAKETVAEGAFAMMIALAKNLLPIHEAMEDRGWISPSSIWAGNDLSGKTVGLVGVGQIGQSLARMAGAGFLANVLGYDPGVSAGTMSIAGIVKSDSLHEMLSQCDFVSIHCVLNEQTRKLIGAAEFECMKSTAILINTARGAIIDEEALLDALRDGKIAGAGLDTFCQEPAAKFGHPLSELYGQDNVILMPHMAFYTQESMQRLETETLVRCLEILEGRLVYVKSKDPRLVSQKHGITFDP